MCEENLKPKADGPPTLAGDLQGFWDMLLLQVDNINAAFNEIREIRENGWKVSSKEPFVNSFKHQIVSETGSAKSSATKRQSPHKTTTHAISNSQIKIK